MGKEETFRNFSKERTRVDSSVGRQAFAGGKSFAKRQSMWDLIFTGLNATRHLGAVSFFLKNLRETLRRAAFSSERGERTLSVSFLKEARREHGGRRAEVAHPAPLQLHARAGGRARRLLVEAVEHSLGVLQIWTLERESS